MNITLFNRCNLAKSLFVLAFVFGSFSLNFARANEHLGVLVELTNPESEITKQLNLTDEQRQQLKQLSTRRIGAALGLGATLSQAPKGDRAKLTAEFVAESERMAFELLNPDQKAKLAKLRIQWLGLASLAEDEVAKALNLADWQKDIVADWREQIRAAKKANNEVRVKPQADRAIRKELSDTQWAAWQLLAGLITETNAGPPMPPERKSTANSPSPSDKVMTASLSPEEASKTPIDKIELEMNFDKQPWSDVIKWLADQADMTVQNGVTPPGTFTYRDRSRKYSVPEVINKMNEALLDSGYALFRSDRLLRCVNFEENQKLVGEFINETADQISVAELKSSKYGRYEAVKVTFTLSRLDPDSIKEEVEKLLSIQGRVKTFVTSGQLQVSDMAGNVRAVAEFIERAEDPMSARGSAVQSLPLKHVNAEEILAVARPLLELQDGSNVSNSIKISTNTFGTVIYAKGDMDKIQILRDLIEAMDIAPEKSGKPTTYEPPYVGRHSVRGLDLQLSYDVISQLLAGTPEVRLAKDDASKQLILMARKAEHELVKSTLDNLAGQSSDFQVIQLQRLDPQMAIAAVKKFFGLTDKASTDSGQPVIDGDLMARQVWVKGTEEQVARIKNLIEELEKNAKVTKNIWGDTVRMIPAGGGSADAVKQAEMMWQQMYGKNNPIVRGSADSMPTGGLRSKSLAPPKKSKDEAEQESGAADPVAPEAKPEAAPRVRPGTSTMKSEKHSAYGRFVTSSQENGQAQDETISFDGEPIVISEAPGGGIMISCKDTEALERFENLLRMVMEQSNVGGDQPEVIYLQNIKAAAAKELLTDVLSGASKGGASGGLLGDMATNVLGGFGGGLLGGILGGSGGSSGATDKSVGLASGDYSIVADPRLNALFVSAAPSDRMLIEQIIKVIDQPESPFPIETRGTTELIPVTTQDVTAVLNTVKAVFGDRIEGNSNRSAGGGGAQPNPAEFIQAMRAAVGGGGARRGGAGGNSELSEPKIAISADTFTNTLIVIAQPSQIEEVRKLVTMIDEAGEGEKEEFVTVNLGKLAGTGLTQSLARIFGSKVQANVTGTTQPGAQPAGGQAVDQTAAARQRAEFFQTLQRGGMGMGGGGQGMGTGGGNRGGGFGGGGFGTGGGGFGGGGGNRGGGFGGAGGGGGGNRGGGGR